MKIDLDIHSKINSSTINSYHSHYSKDNNYKKQSFGMGGALLTAGLQACEQHPMIGVSVIDAATCIIPRAAVDFHTNAHAGLETLRRESSGLLVNCLLPSYFVMGVAGFLKYLSLPKEYRHLGMVNSWANEDTIKTLTSYFKSSTNGLSDDAKIPAYIRSVLGDLQGFNSAKGGWVKYSDSKDVFESAVNVLTKAINGEVKAKDAIASAYKGLAETALATEKIKFTTDNKAFGSNLSSLLRDVVDMGKKFKDPTVLKDVDKFADSAIKFVKQKSFVGLAVILPLAASMQYINRWITRKKSGIKGAPIYRDFGLNNVDKKEGNGKLILHKAVGAGAIIGLAILSMMKKPNLKMFQFKGLFPTLDQARWIAAITFASRVLAAEDCNEVRESTIRDMAGFASLYFLGDYVAKSLATIMHKVNPKIDLINKGKDLDKNAGILARFGNWLKNSSLKAFDEVPKEFKNHRSVCQAASLVVSMLLLGLFIPIWNRRQTEKNRANEIKSNTDTNPLGQGPESTMSLLWHKWKGVTNTFGGFEKMANFK